MGGNRVDGIRVTYSDDTMDSAGDISGSVDGMAISPEGFDTLIARDPFTSGSNTIGFSNQRNGNIGIGGADNNQVTFNYPEGSRISRLVIDVANNGRI